MSNFLIIPIADELEKSLALAEKYNFGFEYDDFFHPNALDDKEHFDKIVRRYQSVRLPEICTLHGDFFDVIIFSEDPEIRRISDMRIKQSISAARLMNAQAVIFHTNHNPFLTAASYVDRWLDMNERYWRTACAENPDINIYIENMFDSSPDMLAVLAERLSDVVNFGVCFDYAHAAVSKVPLAEWVEKLAPYTKHMHINDNDLVNDLHQTIGEGSIDWEEFARLFREKLNPETVLIEISSVEKQEKSAEFLRKIGIL